MISYFLFLLFLLAVVLIEGVPKLLVVQMLMQRVAERQLRLRRGGGVGL